MAKSPSKKRSKPASPVKATPQLVVAISSRALFDLEESHRVFVEEGVDAYCRYQIEHENEILGKGVAFRLVEKLSRLRLGDDSPAVEVVLVSRNSADTGLRIFNSIAHYGLPLTRAAFTNGESPFPYIEPFGAHLFLSNDQDDVALALGKGFAAATILPSRTDGRDNEQLRIAFDGDAVIFTDESERIYQSEGLDAFASNEAAKANEPLDAGPFKPVLEALHRIQSHYPVEGSPIRTALFTARGAPAHERVIRTLRHWGVRIDEALFLGGRPKGEFLNTFGADIFFDDQQGHCDSARAHVPTAHVPHGVGNPQPSKN